MEVNYENNNIVNLSNSILKYFGINTFHNTLEEIDNLLNKSKYQNVILFICDGLGFYNLKTIITKNKYLRKNLISSLESVFPPTTTAATTTILTGLTPSEHNWCGWDMYFKDSNETISLYLNKVKGLDKSPQLNIKDRTYMNYKTIVDLINEKTNNLAYYAYPFSNENKCMNIDEVINRIIKLTKEKKKKFIYAYIDNPDKLMHKYGIYSKIVKDEVNNINNKLENFSKKLKDTVIFVTADHGLIKTKNINLKKDMNEIYNMLERTTSIESRACGIKLKENVRKEEFIKLYNKYLKNDFKLLTVEEVLNINLFGDKKSIYLKDAIGDYLLIGITDKSLNYDENAPQFIANHAGFTKEELMVPLIVLDCK